MCLAAGKSQTPLIRKAKSLGYLIVAVDRDESAIGMKYADTKICQSTYDAEAIIKEIKLIEGKHAWKGVLNRSSGPPVITASKISAYLGLPGVPVDSAITLANKDKMRDACEQHGIPSPMYLAKATENLEKIINESYPVVVKPALSLVGKSGISVVRKEDDFQIALEYAANNTINSKITIEEYLEGPDLTLVGFVDNSQLCEICMLDEINHERKDGTIVGKGFKTHTSNSGDWYLQVKGIAEKLISIFHIERSPFMVSFRSDSEGKLRLMEVHLDLGGDLLMEELFPRALPFDFLKMSIEMAVGIARCPSDYDIRPTAIHYHSGDGLLTDRGCSVIKANTNQPLGKRK